MANCTECQMDTAGNHASNCPFYGGRKTNTLAPATDIDAAEKYAAGYGGDAREDIQIDVLNAFYAGVEFEGAKMAHPYIASLSAAEMAETFAGWLSGLFRVKVRIMIDDHSGNTRRILVPHPDKKK